MNNKLTARAPSRAFDPAGRAESRVERSMFGAREHVDVVVPRTETHGRMRLLSRAEVLKVKADARTYFAELGMPNDPTSLATGGHVIEWNLEIAVRHLAIAVRETHDEKMPLASLEDWRDYCDDDQIGTMWQFYNDLAARLDPVNSNALTEDETHEIEAAVKKKDEGSLISYGSSKLASFLLSTAKPPSP